MAFENWVSEQSRVKPVPSSKASAAPFHFDQWVVGLARVNSKPHKRVTLDDKMALFRQLSTLICAGTPLLRSLRMGGEQSESLRLRGIVEEMAGRVAAGSSLHSAAGAHPDVFETHWVEIIRTGELTGQMGKVLVELNKQIQEARETRRKIVGALAYPMILVFVAIAAVSIMLWMVVPVFAKMFKEMGATLPGMTQLVVGASDFLLHYGAYILGGIFCVVVALRRYMKTDKGRYRVLGLMMATPLIGDLMIQSAMYRFASNTSLLLKSGVPMLETLSVLAGVFGANPIYRDALWRVHARVAAGRSLASSLDETGLFTALVTNMVLTGEESGALSQVMEQVAPYYLRFARVLAGFANGPAA
jgi:type IV pilus assembly protein PilC